ncbi:hypothetical protein Trydic_g12809 [Trypoxylus dichotomus]
MSVYTSELIALYEALKYVKPLHLQQNVLIILNCVSVVEKLCGINMSSRIDPLIIQTYQKIHSLVHAVELLWGKEHIGIVGNETVGTFAILGCTLPEILDHKLSPIDLAQFALKPIYSEF